MDTLESVELDCLNKSESEECLSSREHKKKTSKKKNENESNLKEEKNTMRNLFESFNINGLVANINFEEAGKKIAGFGQEQIEKSVLNKEGKKNVPTSTHKGNNNNNNHTNDYLKCNTINTNTNTMRKLYEKDNTLFDSALIDLDNETRNLEDWDVTQKKIYDPTVGLRKHYTTELLSCGEKNDVRILEKWSSMINRDILWFIRSHKTTYLRRVKRGIPQKYRWKIWVQITNAKPLISKFQKKYYFLSKQKSAYTNLILIDISRTFPELIIFDKYAQQQLYRILNAYSNYEPSVGYCQGMNFVVGLLLLVSNFSELETFCVLVSLMNNYYLKEFYKEKFPLLNKYIYVFEKIIQNEIPDLVEHFNKEEVFPPVYLHQWMLTLFIASLPIKSVIVIWDYLFSTSIKMIIFIAVSLLKILKSYLMKHNFEKILKLLKSLKYNESNDDILIAKLLIKKSDAIDLNDELKFLFENIEQDKVLLSSHCKYAIENITNHHFQNIQNDENKKEEQKNEGGTQKMDGSEAEEYNFVQLDGVPLLNFFANNLLKKKSEEELKPTANMGLRNIDSRNSRKEEINYDDKYNRDIAKRKKETENLSAYYKIFNDQDKDIWEKRNLDIDDANSSKNESNISDKCFFGKHSTENATETTDNHLNKTNITVSVKGINSSNNGSEFKEQKIWNTSKKTYNIDNSLNCAEQFLACTIDENIQKEDSENQHLRIKNKASHKTQNTLDNNNDLNFCNYLSDDSCNSRNMAKSSIQWENNDLNDHLYKSDSFVESYQKRHKTKENDDNNYYCNNNNIDNNDNKNKSSSHFNLCNENITEEMFQTITLTTRKSLTINVEAKQRKSDGHIQRHAYYKNSRHKEGTHEEDIKSENLILKKMSKYEHELNAKEKLEMDKYQDMKNKMKREKEKGKKKTMEKEEEKEEEEGEEEQEQEKEQEKEQEDEEEIDGHGESVLNISHYIQSNENEQTNSENDFGFFNMLQSYTKDNNWFDVSTINKYYQFNKNNMDYELNDINFKHNTKQSENKKRGDDNTHF